VQIKKVRALIARDCLVDRELQMKKAMPHQTDLAISLPYEDSLLALILQRASVCDLDHQQRMRDLLGHHDLQQDLVRDEIVLLVLEITARTKVLTTDVDCQMLIRLRVNLLSKS